jgi:hypothetical protein
MNWERVLYSAVRTGLAAWLLATAANQLPDSRFDGLLAMGRWRVRTPNWRFFGPNPGVEDTHVLYRDIVGGTPGTWAELVVPAERPWYGLAWNPKNRAPKTIFDSLQMITRAANLFAGDMARIPRSVGYRFLERYICEYVSHDPHAEYTQFMMLRSHPESTMERREVEPVFASEYVPLPAAAATTGDSHPLSSI